MPFVDLLFSKSMVMPGSCKSYIIMTHLFEIILRSHSCQNQEVSEGSQAFSTMVNLLHIGTVMVK